MGSPIKLTERGTQEKEIDLKRTYIEPKFLTSYTKRLQWTDLHQHYGFLLKYWKRHSKDHIQTRKLASCGKKKNVNPRILFE